MKKDEIVESLEDHLQANATRLSRNAIFEGYYGVSVPRRTPAKARSPSRAGTGSDVDVKSVVTARGRRTTKIKSELEEYVQCCSHSTNQSRSILTASSLNDGSYAPSPSQQLSRTSNAVATRTPGRVGRPRRSELPPSPADIADDVEYTTSQLSTSLSDLYANSGMTERIESLRENLSSVHAVQVTLILLEALALQREILPWQYVFDIPPLAIFGTPSIPIGVPDLFMLLTPLFWSTTLLWASTSLVGPLIVAYFYNLSTTTVRRGGQRVNVARYSADPMTFNVVKALLSYIVYGRSYNNGLWTEHTAFRVQHAMPGGPTGMLIGSAIGALASLYEAAQSN